MSIEAGAGRGVSLFLAGCVALSIAAQLLAWPRFGAAVLALPARPVIQSLLDGKAVERDAVVAAVERKRKALRFADDAESHQALSTAFLYLAQNGAEESRKKDLSAALAATEDALKRSPSSPWLWFRAASIRYGLFGARPEAVKAMELSLQTGRYEPDVIVPRLALMMRLRAAGGDGLEAQISPQIMFAWRTAPVALLKAARTEGFVGDISDALAADPGQLDKWKKFMAAMPSN
jgi:hypothetical protein